MQSAGVRARLQAEPDRLGRVVLGGARGVAPVRLEARLHPATLAAPAPVGGLAPVVAVERVDPRGDHQVAVDLVALGDRVARVDRVLLAEVARGAHRRVEVLHEHAAGAGDAVEVGQQLVAGAQRPGQVVAAVDHQPVPEAVDALVEQELLGVHRRGAAEMLRLLDDHVPRQPGQRDLEDAVVVARVAGHRAVRERLAGVVLVVDEAGAPDPVRDLVAVGVDAGDARVVGRQQRERLLGPLAVGEVAERLPEAEGLAAPARTRRSSSCRA